MARRAKFSVVGLPHYTIWHLYEPSTDDLKHMKEMEEQKLAKEKAEKEKPVGILSFPRLKSISLFFSLLSSSFVQISG